MTRDQITKIVGERSRAYLREHLPQNSAVKHLARIIGQSVGSAARLYTEGAAPTTAHVAMLARHFGGEFLTYVFGEEAPTAAELAEVEAMRRALDVEVAVPAVHAARAVVSAAGQSPASPVESGSDRAPARLGSVVVRRSLDVVASKRSHLADHLRRWAESSGKAERSSLVNMARQTPHLRASLVTRRGDDLLFGHISPAFRLHAVDRERLIGKPTTETFDRDYAEGCARNMRDVMDSGRPAVDDVDATVAVEPGVSLHLRYRRLVLPYLEGRTPFAVCASEPIAGTA